MTNSKNNTDHIDNKDWFYGKIARGARGDEYNQSINR